MVQTPTTTTTNSTSQGEVFKLSAQEEINKKEFGARLRRLRKAKKLTAMELGEKIDVAESTITNYERGIRMPNPIQLAEIARILGVSTDFLISENEEELRNLKSLIATKDLNWNGYKLNDMELDQLKNFLEFMIRNKIDPEKKDTAE